MYLYASDPFPDDINLSEAINESLKIVEATSERDFLRKVIKYDREFLETLAYVIGHDFVNQETVDMYMEWISDQDKMEYLIDQAQKLCLGKKLFYVTLETLKIRTDEEFQLNANF